jgi:hypothetical protein
MKIKDGIKTAVLAGLLCVSTLAKAINSEPSKTTTTQITSEKGPAEHTSPQSDNSKEAIEHAGETIPLFLWQNLPQDIKSTLAQVETKWDSFTPEKKQLLITGAQRWLSLNTEQKQEFTQRYNRWYQLPEAKRQYFADLWNQYKQLSPFKQNKIRMAFKRFNRMSEESREQLWAQWRQLPSEQRRLYQQQTFGIVGSASSKITLTKSTSVSKKAVFPIIKSGAAKKKDK